MIENDFSVLVLYCITDHKLIYHQKDARAVDITTGEVIASERKRTHAEKGQEYMSQHITHLSTAALEAAKLPAGATIVAVGVGAAGQIDRKNGVV